MQEIQVQADSAETEALYKTYFTNIKWVDALNGCVRPIIAFAFFLDYVIVKLLILHYPDSATLIWSEEDAAIFGAVIGFYFGNRSFNRRK